VLLLLYQHGNLGLSHQKELDLNLLTNQYLMSRLE
jgi:hypothetical protein